MRRFIPFCLRAICLLTGLLFLFLFVYSLFTGYLLHEQSGGGGDYPYVIRQNTLLVLLGLAAGLWLLDRITRIRWRLRTVALIPIGFTLVAGCAWVCLLRMWPRWDQLYCYELAYLLANGEIEQFCSHFYINAHPYQMGFVLYRTLLELIFGTHSNLACAIGNVGFLALMQAVILYEANLALRNSPVRRPVFLLLCALMLSCLQPLLLCNLLYGNLPAISLAVCSISMVLRYARKPSVPCAAGALGLLVLACLLKPNIDILCIALCLCMLLYAAAAKRHRLCCAAFALCLLLPMASSTLLQKIMECCLQHSFGSSVPMLAYLTMGIMESYRMCGWFNNYTLANNFVDFPDAENRARVLNDLLVRLREMAASPMETLHFFELKLTSMWLETSFGALQITRGANLLAHELPHWGYMLLIGRRARLLCFIFTAWVQLVYLGFGLSCMRLFKAVRQAGTAWLAPMITILLLLGVVLYHALFEAKSLYVFSYLQLMTPVAALGLWGLLCRLRQLVKAVREKLPRHR